MMTTNLSGRREYEMSEEDYKALLDACKPTPAMYRSGGQLMFGTPQENANAAWKRLGEKMGFLSMSVQPVRGKPPRVFSAIPDADAVPPLPAVEGM